MKTIVFYHSADHDGFCSGAIAKLKFPDAELIGYDYHKELPWDKIPLDDCQVFMIDVSMPMQDMRRLSDLTHGRFVWIDHHKSAIDDWDKYIALNHEQACKCHCRSGIAACELAWEYFFPEQEMPEGVRLLGEYDTWRDSDKIHWEHDILPFQFGARTYYKGVNELNNALKEGLMNSPQAIEEVKKIGKVVLDYQAQQNYVQCGAAFEMVFEGLPAVCLNAGGFNSQVFDSVYDRNRHKIMVMFKFDGSGWRVSLYTDHADVDCSAYAKQRGGGGHRAAAGFRVEGTVVPFSGPKVERKPQS